MAHPHLDELIELDLEGLLEAHIHIVSGAVAATATAGIGRVRVRHHSSTPVEVTFEQGVLEVRREDQARSLLDGLRDDIVVELTAPEDVLVRVGVVSAPVVARGFADRVDVQSVSGAVTLDALAGPVRAKTVSGDVEARGLTDTLSVNTVSGDLTLVEGRCGEVDAKTVSGDVVLDLHLDDGGAYSVNTVSGAVALRLDDAAGADLDVSSATGRIDSAFDVGSRRGVVGEQLRGQLGDGGARIKVRTMSGRVSLLRPARA